MCPQRSPPRKTVVCTQPVWDLAGVDAADPALVRTWLEYHLDVLGLDHIQMYDVDGSWGPRLQPFVDEGRVSYVPSLDRVLQPRVPFLDCPMCHYLLGQTHCLFEHSSAEWMVHLHFVDSFLVPDAWDPETGAPRVPLSVALDNLTAQNCHAAVVATYEFRPGAGVPGGGVLANHTLRPTLGDGVGIFHSIADTDVYSHGPMREEWGKARDVRFSVGVVEGWQMNHYTYLFARSFIDPAQQAREQSNSIVDTILLDRLKPHLERAF